MFNRKISSQPVYSFAIATALVVSVLLTFGSLIGAVAGIESYL